MQTTVPAIPDLLLMSTRVHLQPGGRERKVMESLTRLSYADKSHLSTVHAVLDLIEELISSPIVCLSVHEFGKVEHTVRAGVDTPPEWAVRAGKTITQGQEQRLLNKFSSLSCRQIFQDGPSPWMAGSMARTRSGTQVGLVFGSPEPIPLTAARQELVLRLVDHVALVLDHALLAEKVDRLRTVDDITGIVNHRGLLEILEYEIQRHRYYGRTLALALSDVEGLRKVNQSFGNQYGDHLLRKVGGLLREMSRPVDVVARSGRDRFVIVLPEMDGDEGRRWLETVRDRLMEVEFAAGAIRMGAAATHMMADQPVTPEELISRGEQALKESKQQQRKASARLMVSERSR
ncbi:MAG: GGDEF domain-containing protein [Chloroflexota bacterium]